MHAQREDGAWINTNGTGGAIFPAYFVLGDSFCGGRAAVSGVEVLVVGCIPIHVERQDKPPWEDSTQGVIHLKETGARLASLSGFKPPCVPLTSSRASPDLRRFWRL